MDSFHVSVFEFKKAFISVRSMFPKQTDTVYFIMHNMICHIN